MDRRWRRWAAQRPLAADAALAAAALLVELVVAAAVRPDENSFLVAAFSVLGAVAIALRRVAPWWAVGLTLASLSSVIVVGRSPFTSVLSFVVLTYTFASRSTFRAALAAAFALWLPVLVIGMVPAGAATDPARRRRCWCSTTPSSPPSRSSSAARSTTGGPRPARWRNGPARRRPTRRRWPPRRSPTSAAGSPANCTTSSPTTSA